MIVPRSEGHYSFFMNTNHSLYPGNDFRHPMSLPSADHSRLHTPTRVDEYPFLREIIEELKLTHTGLGPQEGFYISMINASQFPYANGRREAPYFYSVVQQDQPSVECMDLSTIIKFRTHDYIQIFWLIPATDATGNKRWFHLYSNSVWRDAAVCRDFIIRLKAIAEALAKERSSMISV